MYLTLEVVSPQAASLGAERRKVVGPEGLTIGRVPGNGWVIPDPYISKQHARISFSGERFFVEVLGRNPIALGRSDNTLNLNKMYPLSNGDRLFIDQYEISVAVQQGDAPGFAPVRAAPPIGSIAASDDPFALISERAVPPAVPSVAASSSASAVIPPAWDSSVLQSPGDTATLDPLAVMGGGAPPAPEAPPPVNWQQASPLTDHLELPSIRPTTDGIPTNWDQSVIVPVEPPPPPAPPLRAEPPRPSSPRPAPRPAVQPPPAVQPRTPVAPSTGNGAGRAAPRQTSAPPSFPGAAPSHPGEAASFPRAHTPLQPGTPPPSHHSANTTPLMPPSFHQSAAAPLQSQPSFQQATAAPTWPAQQSTASAHAPGVPPDRRPAAVSADFAELLRGAGMSEQDISPEVMNELGRVLRVVVQGLMEVLQARSEIKSQFRLPLTRVKAAENNPLKLSPNVESALHTLLVQRNAGYLGTVPAFEDAFADIRSHQMAMLEGVRAAFQSMLESFDPRQLEDRFDASAKRGGNLLSNLGGKPKYWDLYKERFERLAGDPDDTFRRLFGDVFAEAYEKQLERLRVAGRDAGRK
jgi:type VI secretion system FHA domain protein